MYRLISKKMLSLTGSYTIRSMNGHFAINEAAIAFSDDSFGVALLESLTIVFYR